MSTDNKMLPRKSFSRFEESAVRNGVAETADYLMRMQDRFHDVSEQMALSAFQDVCDKYREMNWGNKRVRPRKQKNPKRYLCKK